MGAISIFVGDVPTVFHRGLFFFERRRTHDRSVCTHTIDAKGRLFIPAALRKELGQTFHITVGQDRCLSVYSDESWAAFMDKLKALSYNEVKKLRALFAYAADCDPDGQGRILIPAKLREYAGLTREVVVIGSFDRAEIWDAERWAAVENDAFASGELESAMAEMGL